MIPGFGVVSVGLDFGTLQSLQHDFQKFGSNNFNGVDYSTLTSPLTAGANSEKKIGIPGRVVLKSWGQRIILRWGTSCINIENPYGY